MTEQIRMAWEAPSAFGVEKPIMSDIAKLLEPLEQEPSRIADILTSVSEACLNALEHGNKLQPDRHVHVQLQVRPEAFVFRVYDEGDADSLPDSAPRPANTRGKRANKDARGWGLYLIRSFADEVSSGRDGGMFYVELTFWRERTRRERDNA